MSDEHDSGLHASPWVRRARRVAYANPWITVYHDAVERPDGSPGIYGVVHFPGRAIGVVPIDDEGRVVLVGQFRYPLGRYSWEIPEGAAGADEDPLEAARRELAEETGLSGDRWREIARADLSNSVTDEEAVVFTVTGLHAGDARPEPTEQLDIRAVPFDEVLDMVLDGRITDGISVIAIQRLAIERLRADGGAVRPGGHEEGSAE
jgi:8-oxo-dGTP pyrophosphatase MutT (NUDIX family)